MNRILIMGLVGAVLGGGLGVFMATAGDESEIFIASDQPSTESQVREKLRSEGWLNVQVMDEGRYLEITGSKDGQARKMMLDAEREELLRLRDEGAIGDAVMRRLQRELDLEQILLASADSADLPVDVTAAPAPVDHPEADRLERLRAEGGGFGGAVQLHKLPQREAELLASLNHPNIAHVYGLERANGALALVMELVEGPTLADRIAEGPVPLAEALPIARQIAACGQSRDGVAEHIDVAIHLGILHDRQLRVDLLHVLGPELHFLLRRDAASRDGDGQQRAG